MTQKNKHAGQADRENRMNVAWYSAALLAVQLLLPSPAEAADEGAAAPEYVKPLGNEKYQVGRIVVDRKRGSFTLPARVHVIDKPLEYLLTTRDGVKEYETLLETDVIGTEFNLACILIGLESAEKRRAAFQFSLEPLEGPPIEITLSWSSNGREMKSTALQALVDPEQIEHESVEWVYVGSYQSDGNQFAADLTGTLIGFVHDPNTVIDSRIGLGIGAYGSVNGNEKLLPPVGSPVRLTVTVLPGPGSSEGESNR